MIVIYTDGGARGNPGPAAIGIVIHRPKTKKETFGKYIGITTNNIAEYTAVLEAIRYIKKTTPQKDDIHFFLDSELVQRQLLGIYRIKHPVLRRLLQEIKQEIILWGKPVVFTHIPRENNKEADRIVNMILEKN